MCQLASPLPDFELLTNDLTWAQLPRLTRNLIQVIVMRWRGLCEHLKATLELERIRPLGL